MTVAEAESALRILRNLRLPRDPYLRLKVCRLIRSSRQFIREGRKALTTA